jgi:sugar diacid utilization regulator
MADYDMNREAVSRVLGCHRNTVTYRLDGIMKITKYDPRVFYDLVELIELVGRGEAG